MFHHLWLRDCVSCLEVCLLCDVTTALGYITWQFTLVDLDLVCRFVSLILSKEKKNSVVFENNLDVHKDKSRKKNDNVFTAAIFTP